MSEWTQHVYDPKRGELGRGREDVLLTLPLKMQLYGLSLAISAVLELCCFGPRSNFPAAEVKALPPQLLNLTNYTWAYSNMKKCALCSWPLGQPRDQIPAHRKAPLIFIKSHGRPALHCCGRGDQAAGCCWTPNRSAQRKIDSTFCSWATGQLAPGFFFFKQYLSNKRAVEIRKKKERGFVSV